MKTAGNTVNETVPRLKVRDSKRHETRLAQHGGRRSVRADDRRVQRRIVEWK
jgi:hypothetical protein